MADSETTLDTTEDLDEPRPEQLISMLSHELRTPVQALTISLELMMTRLESSADDFPREWCLSTLGRMRRSTDRLTNLINTFLGAAQISAGRSEPDRESVDLAVVVQNIVDKLQDDLDWAGCECRFDPRAPVVGRWDPIQLELIVANLVSNAMKYGAGKPIEIELFADDKTARLAVRDRGVGIAPEHHQRIFQKFVRVPGSSATSGVGLGLWMVKHFVDAHGGKIELESAPGAGSTFMVTLPR
jgi:signal transduction histidine kinase